MEAFWIFLGVLGLTALALVVLAALHDRKVEDDGYMRQVQRDPWPELLMDPEFVQALDEGLADEKAGRLYVRDGAGGWKKGPDWPEDDAA